MAKQIVNYEGIDSNRQELELIFNHINTILVDVKQSCASITSSEIWNGKAADFFVQKMNSISDNFSTINNELKSVVNYMSLNVENYKNFEKNIINNIRN